MERNLMTNLRYSFGICFKVLSKLRKPLANWVRNLAEIRTRQSRHSSQKRYRSIRFDRWNFVK